MSHCGSPASTAAAVTAGCLPGSLEFIERLRMRLGELAVHGLICQDSHCPEGASRPLSPADPQFQRAAAAPRDDGMPARPLWLLEDRSCCVSRQGWPQLDGPLRLRHGPERIESQWWEAPGRRARLLPCHRCAWHCGVGVPRARSRRIAGSCTGYPDERATAWLCGAALPQPLHLPARRLAARGAGAAGAAARLQRPGHHR